VRSRCEFDSLSAAPPHATERPCVRRRSPARLHGRARPVPSDPSSLARPSSG
jgi:hypothetical protein